MMMLDAVVELSYSITEVSPTCFRLFCYCAGEQWEVNSYATREDAIAAARRHARMPFAFPHMRRYPLASY